MTESHPQEQQIPLLVLVGPTAVGKTAIALEMAKQFNGEIVSADSVQVYRQLDIGTAKPTLAERQLVPHHLIDVVEPSVDFTVYDYQQLARKIIGEIHARGKLPLLTGGTGLYIKAVLDGFTFSSGKSNNRVRQRLQEELAARGKDYLHRLLKKEDPVSAGQIHPNDVKRVMRALEYFYMTGEPIWRQKERTHKEKSPYKPLITGLYMPREQLYKRIDQRAEQMIEAGFLDEVIGLIRQGYDKRAKALQALGYRHIVEYLEGENDWETTLSSLKRDTRRYAKRQLTWFCADWRIRWSNLSGENKINIDHFLENISTQLAGY